MILYNISKIHRPMCRAASNTNGTNCLKRQDCDPLVRRMLPPIKHSTFTNSFTPLHTGCSEYPATHKIRFFKAHFNIVFLVKPNPTSAHYSPFSITQNIISFSSLPYQSNYRPSKPPQLHNPSLHTNHQTAHYAFSSCLFPLPVSKVRFFPPPIT
jgi:hypothetical protein